MKQLSKTYAENSALSNENKEEFRTFFFLNMLTVITDISESECSFASLIFKNLKCTICLRRTQRQKQVMQVIKPGYHHFLSAKHQCKQDMALKSFIQDILQILERKNMLMKNPGLGYSLLHSMPFELPEVLSQDRLDVGWILKRLDIVFYPFSA